MSSARPPEWFGRVRAWLVKKREWLAPDARQSFPLATLVLTVGSLLIFAASPERDETDTQHPLFFYPPDLTEDPLRILPQLFLTPILNTQLDQIILVTGLFVLFALPFELRMGTLPTFACFWLCSVAGALLGSALLHILVPLFEDVPSFIERGWERTFNGGSAGGWGIYAAFAATTRRPWLWLAGFGVWEVFWFLTLTGDFTIFFHLIAVVTGFLFGLWLVRRDR